MVLIHGAGGNYLNWPPEIRRLPGYPIYAIDLPGHGQSGGSGQSSINGYAYHLVEWLQALNIPQVILVGHSMGAAIAMRLTILIPQLVRGLCIIGGSAHMKVNPALLEITSSPTTYQNGVNTIIQWSFSRETPARLKELAAHRMAKTQPRVLQNDFLACRDFDIIGSLQGITAPTLIICGREDKMTPARQAQFLAEQLPQARLEIIPGAGHMVMIEQPRAVAALLADFAEEIKLEGSAKSSA